MSTSCVDALVNTLCEKLSNVLLPNPIRVAKAQVEAANKCIEEGLESNNRGIQAIVEMDNDTYDGFVRKQVYKSLLLWNSKSVIDLFTLCVNALTLSQYVDMPCETNTKGETELCDFDDVVNISDAEHE